MNAITLSTKPLLYPLLIIALLINACASTRQENPAPEPSVSRQSNEAAAQYGQNRPVPNSITDEIPDAFFEAVESGTRTISGEPGPAYWQNQSDYQIDTEIFPAQKRVTGKGTITYYNNSPDTLRQVFLELSQNVHKPGVPRNETAEITGGLTIKTFSYNGEPIDEIERRGQVGYNIDGTTMVVTPRKPLMPGASVRMQASWEFTIPQQGAGGRMGYDSDNLLFIAYWYPKVSVYDDVVGWFTDPFLINAEFYNEFGNYNVNVTVPGQWIVAGTGELTNADTILQPAVLERLQQAQEREEIITVVNEDDFGRVTRSGGNEKVTWNFTASDVNDVAFSVTRESIWDATRTAVGDRNGDGSTDYATIHALYRSSAPLWKEAARYQQHAIRFLSEHTGLRYPWPHMTAVEGGGIIGGGMEFPMITLTGAYQGRDAESLYAVLAHELAHMWIPMQVATNERRYAWIDEGTTTFSENQAKKAFWDKPNTDQDEFRGYTRITGTDLEGPLMRWSDYHYNGAAYGTASYAKPAAILVTLRGLLGEELFREAYHTFMQRWQYKHPYPWDLFNTFEDVTGRDLGWFWRSWFYETWELDQGIAGVSETADGTQILVQDYGRIPMPATVKITLASGRSLTRTIDVDTWLKGATSAILTVDGSSEVVKAEIDPEHLFPDADRSNNTWQR